MDVLGVVWRSPYYPCIQVSSPRHYQLFIILQSHKCPGNIQMMIYDDLEYFRSKSLDKIAASRRWTTRLIRPADSRYNSWNNCTIFMYVFNELENLPHSLSRLIFNFVRSSELLEHSKVRCYNYNCRDQFFDDNCSK